MKRRDKTMKKLFGVPAGALLAGALAFALVLGFTGCPTEPGDGAETPKPTVVSAFDLTTLVTAPAKGVAPVTTAIDQVQYTGTVKWQTQDGTAFTGAAFGAGTVYQAAVTLTAKTDYTFTGVAANSFTHTGAASVANAADSGIVTIVFPATKAEGGTEPAVVSAFNLTALVTAPVKDAAPVATAIDEDQYSGTVAWQTENGDGFDGAVFVASTVYQAAVTLTAKDGYTFTGVAVNSFTYTGATVTNAAGSGAVTIVFPATGAEPQGQLFTSLADMTSWLDDQADNTAETPYEVALAGLNVSDFATTDPTDPLGALFAALHGKYVALDLIDCTGTAIGDVASAVSDARTDKNKLVSLTLPSTLTSIGTYAFYGITGLVSVDLSGLATVSGTDQFHGCTSLVSVKLSSASLSSISMRMFYGCTSLTTVALSNKVTSIGVNAFYSCTSLAAIDLPASVETIGQTAFYGCNRLSTIVIRKADEVVSVAFTSGTGDSFKYTSANLLIYVPDTLVETYKTASKWSVIAAKIKALSELP
jgi:hypothetical protein